MQLRAYLDNLAEDLGDWPDRGGALSFVRWSREYLQNAVHEARCTIATVYRRREHAAVIDIPLTAGGVFDLRAYGARVVRIMELRRSGQVVQRVTEAATAKRDWAALWTPTIEAEPAWEPATFRLAKVVGADTIITIDPPVPTDEQYQLRVLMEGAPPAAWQLTDEIDSCQYLAAIRRYALATALSAQVESPAAVQLSTAHMAAFRDLIGAARVADAEAAREAK